MKSKNKLVRAEKYYGYTVLDSGAILSRVGEFKQMKTKTDINGHVVLNLCHPTWKLMPCGMRVRTKQVSRLVAMAFLGLDIDNPDICVMHEDGNLNNNSYDNLYLADRKTAVKFRMPKQV